MQTLFQSEGIKYPLVRRGKVRDVYSVEDKRHLIIVACDRISAFDHVLPTPVPGKGEILTRMSNYWFDQTTHIVPNHLVDIDPVYSSDWHGHAEHLCKALRGRTVLVKKAEPLPIEAIVRGYLVGSGWKEYCHTGCVCGISLASGLTEADKLPEPLFTPSTKAGPGQHDENISFNKAVDLVGKEIAQKVKELSLRLYTFAAEFAESRGIIIADTKFEFGIADGELLLIDEVLTPDSSRFWPTEAYQPGISPPSFDKQYVRDYLEEIKWNKQPPAPELPENVVLRTTEKYREALRRLLAGNEK